jgi:hypothetical protein
VGKRVTFVLSAEDRLHLQDVIHRGSDWRDRERSKILILMYDGLSMQMSAKCRDSKTLEADVDDILDNFGSRYKFAF